MYENKAPQTKFLFAPRCQAGMGIFVRLYGFEGEGGSQLWMLLGAAVQEAPLPVSAVYLDTCWPGLGVPQAVHGPSLYLSGGEAGASEGSA